MRPTYSEATPPPSHHPCDDKAMWTQLHKDEALVSSEDVLHGVAMVLEHFIARCDQTPRAELKPTIFDGPVSMDCTVRAFLDHIMTSGLCSKECFIMSLIYGERVMQRHPDFAISRGNVHRFVLVSVLVGSKILDDFYCRNVYYAIAGGITKAELNELELQLCFLLDFDLNVTPEEFALYRDSLIRVPQPSDATMVPAGAQTQEAAMATTTLPMSPPISPPATPTYDADPLNNPLSFGLSPGSHPPWVEPVAAHMPSQQLTPPPPQQQQQQQALMPMPMPMQDPMAPMLQCGTNPIAMLQININQPWPATPAQQVLTAHPHPMQELRMAMQPGPAPMPHAMAITPQRPVNPASAGFGQHWQPRQPHPQFFAVAVAPPPKHEHVQLHNTPWHHPAHSLFHASLPATPNTWGRAAGQGMHNPPEHDHPTNAMPATDPLGAACAWFGTGFGTGFGSADKAMAGDWDQQLAMGAWPMPQPA